VRLTNYFGYISQCTELRAQLKQDFRRFLKGNPLQISTLKTYLRDYKTNTGLQKSLKYVEIVCEIIATKQLVDKKNPTDGKTWLIIGRIVDMLWEAGFRTKQ
jgi:hypothetical protein